MIFRIWPQDLRTHDGIKAKQINWSLKRRLNVEVGSIIIFCGLRIKLDVKEKQEILFLVILVGSFSLNITHIWV